MNKLQKRLLGFFCWFCFIGTLIGAAMIILAPALFIPAVKNSTHYSK